MEERRGEESGGEDGMRGEERRGEETKRSRIGDRRRGEITFGAVEVEMVQSLRLAIHHVPPIDRVLPNSRPA